MKPILSSEVWYLAWPIMLSNISIPLLGMVDTAVVDGARNPLIDGAALSVTHSLDALAAHEISFPAYLLAFSLAVNMGQALQIVMGECIGQKQESFIPHAYKIAICLLSGLVFIVAMIVWCLPTLIIHLVLGGKNLANTEVAPLALCLLRIMPLFLFFDSLAFLTLSALRALKKTKMSLVIVIAIYWLLIIPSLSVGVLHLHILNPQDLWIALALGALISFILQSIYFRLQLKRLA